MIFELDSITELPSKNCVEYIMHLKLLEILAMFSRNIWKRVVCWILVEYPPNILSSKTFYLKKITPNGQQYWTI